MGEFHIRHYCSSMEYMQTLQRDSLHDPELSANVAAIITKVRQEGDKALLRFTDQFDKVKRQTLSVTQAEWQNANDVSNDNLSLIAEAAENIRRFHRAEFQQLSDWYLQTPGEKLGQKMVPIQRIGVYVPGGTAIYPSSVLMNIIPAQIAGVPQIVLVSPPGKKSGSVHPMILVAAKLIGIGEIYATGGAQAIAALAYGTESIHPVDKITGPGNRFVAEAKRQVFGHVGIDSIAGPSEIVIVADDSANPRFIAADLLAQAEHDYHARAILITDDNEILTRVEMELLKQVETLLRREIAKTALKNKGALIKVDHLEEAIALVNEIAPEHLELNVAQPDLLLESVKNAGAVFLGHFTPESVGDYWAGSNHVLPTAGNARFASALSVRDYLRWISVVDWQKEKLEKENQKIAKFARIEELEAHARAVEYRFTGE